MTPGGSCRDPGVCNRAGAANGYDHFEVVVDDMSRVAYVAPVPDESGASAARALLDAALVRAALGPLSSDEDAVAVVIPVFGRWVIGSLQEAGRTSDEAESLVADLLASWLETRSPPGR